MQAVGSLTRQLRLYSNGDREAADRILREAMPTLRKIAAGKLAKPRFSRSATPTELIGETWVNRLHGGHWKVESREHFFALAGRAMEQMLIDMARKRVAQRRGEGAIHVSLDDISPGGQPRSADAEQVLAIQLLLGQLEKKEPVIAAIVRAHYVAGVSLEEIAQESSLTLRQVRYLWKKGKLWLAVRLFPHHPQLK